MRLLLAEYLKYKRTLIKKLILFSPFIFLTLVLIQLLLLPTSFKRDWQLLVNQIYNFWSILFIPFGYAILTILLTRQEQLAGNYRLLKTRVTDARILWLIKIIILACWLFISHIILIIIIFMAGIIGATGKVPVNIIISASLTSWYLSLVLIPIYLFCSHYLGLLATMLLAMAGFISSIFMATQDIWWLNPWSWSLRLLAPIAKLNPNGLVLASGDPLLNSGVVPIGFMLATVALLAVSCLTARWFNSSEVK